MELADHLPPDQQPQLWAEVAATAPTIQDEAARTRIRNQVAERLPTDNAPPNVAQAAASGATPAVGECRIGLHASADPDIPEAEFKEFADLRPGIIKILSFHRSADVQRLARAFPGASWILRAWLNFSSGTMSAQQFVDGTLPDVRRLAQVLSGRDLVVELHNEPNTSVEGLGRAWTDGATFASWWLDVLSRYRTALPGQRFIYPGLSPGAGVSTIKLDQMQFVEASRAAIEAADGLGVHLYWSADNPLISALTDLDNLIRRFPLKPIWVTEASNNEAGASPAEKAQQYLQLWRELRRRPIVRGVTFFVASARNPALAEEVWVGRGLGALVGQRDMA
jgi:hypothetical protein